MILITGGTGFIGAHLLKKLKATKIRCLVRKDITLGDNVETVKGDLTDVKSLEEATKGVSVVVHLAAVIKSNKKEDFEKINIKGTKKLIEACIKNKVKRFIHISSYDAILNDRYDYAYSKLKSEEILKNSGLDYLILRPTVVYGKNDKESLGGLFNIIKKYSFAPVIGNGEYKLQPVYIDDLIKVILICLKSNNVNKTYFIAGSEALTFNQIIDQMAKVLSKKVIRIHFPLWLLKILLKPYELLSKHPYLTYKKILAVTENKICDITQIEKEFNFRPMGFEEGLKKFNKA